MSEVTRLLEALDRGEPRAAEDLLPLVYEELRRLAHQKMAREKPGQTLQATALVHEAWLNLVAPDQPHWKGRAHFFGAAAEAMRRILIANARRKRREKRGAGWERIPLEEIEVADQADPETLSFVNEALEKLAVVDPQKAELVKLRFFVGLTNAETAEVLGLSPATATRYWAFARAWLMSEISRQDAGHGP
jgi:RNA polymerase sigma factor (TIGR02999 family)